jgi:hypothetical protein
MSRRKQIPVKPTYFVTEPYMEVDGFPISQGDIIKVHGEWGAKFKFMGVTTNNLTGSSWVDCFEIIKGVPSVFRSFKQDRIKRVPKRGKRASRVSGAGIS